MMYLCNGISSSMLHDPNMKEIRTGLSESEFVELINHANFKSIIGHEDLADVLTELTGVTIQYNRQAIRVGYDDHILLVSMDGRLPEHPTLVEYEGRLKYSFVRFEKQTSQDFANTVAIINKIKGAV